MTPTNRYLGKYRTECHPDPTLGTENADDFFAWFKETMLLVWGGYAVCRGFWLRRWNNDSEEPQ